MLLMGKSTISMAIIAIWCYLMLFVCLPEGISEDCPRHVVLFNLAATGHMNPTLPLVTELVARGVPVSYFVQEKVRPVVEATGAKWYPLQDRRNFQKSVWNVKVCQTSKIFKGINRYKYKINIYSDIQSLFLRPNICVRKFCWFLPVWYSGISASTFKTQHVERWERERRTSCAPRKRSLPSTSLDCPRRRHVFPWQSSPLQRNLHRFQTLRRNLIVFQTKCCITHDGSMVLLYMATWIPSTKTPVMLAFFYQHHGSVIA